MPARREDPTIDHVIGRFPRESLSSALVATHRAGFGPQARVVDGARGDAAGQLARMGLHLIDGRAPASDALLIVVTAPGRTVKVAEIFAQAGAEEITLAARSGETKARRARPDALVPDILIDENAGASSRS